MRTVLISCAFVAPFLVSCSASLQKTIRDLGYKPVSLPSGAHRPGKVVSVVSEDPFQADTVCEAGSYVGSLEPTAVPAATIEAHQKVSGTFTLGADFLKEIRGDAGYQYVKDISVTLNNVVVEEIPRNQVFEHYSDQKTGCTRAIESERKRDRIGFLQSAIKADAVYSVTFDQKASLTAEAKHELLRGLALQLGASPQSVSDNKISGSNLYWGVRPPDPDLVIVKTNVAQQVAVQPQLLREVEKSDASENRDGMRCNGRSPCSPDGRWFATITTLTLSAGAGQELRSSEVQCSGAGCTHRELMSLEISPDGTTVTARIKTWSHSVTLKLVAQLWGQPAP